jgi:hypothetical protein
MTMLRMEYNYAVPTKHDSARSNATTQTVSSIHRASTKHDSARSAVQKFIPPPPDRLSQMPKTRNLRFRSFFEHPVPKVGTNTRSQIGCIRYAKGTLNPKARTQNTKHKTRNTKHETRNTKHETRNTKPRTPNTKHETQNIKHLTIYLAAGGRTPN